jgi:hypothetical protein
MATNEENVHKWAARELRILAERLRGSGVLTESETIALGFAVGALDVLAEAHATTTTEVVTS